jgi:signal transduction histidine kinase
MRIIAIGLAAEEDVVAARQCAREVARALGFDPQDQIRIATAVSELARNAVSYARDGRIEFLLEEEGTQRALVVNVADGGSGIADLDAVMNGTYRSATGMGKGIAGARRLMDRFRIDSGPTGTFIAAAKALPRHAPPLSCGQLPKIAERLARGRVSAAAELRVQNAELLLALEDLHDKTEELQSLTGELESTNRGVVALHGELEATAAELRRASDHKSRFLSNVSHELRTPLNSILALSRLLLDRTDGDLSEEQERQVRFIATAAAGLTDLVNDLLDIAKVEAGKVDVKPTRFTVYDLFGALRGLLKPLRTSESVELVFEEPSEVPVLFSDEGKITQILRNFIANALKFTSQGEVRVTAQYQAPDRILFGVSDTGIGIPKEYHERIFEEFEQVPHAMQSRTKGTGLGLPLSRKYAELLRGTVAVVSEPGGGSTFFLDVPIHYDAAGESETAVAAERTSARARVLIADDEEAFRYVMRRMIDAASYEIIETGDGDGALSLAREALPDVIILDINMPRRDGYAVLDQLGQRPETARIPVIVSSSLVLSDRDRQRLARSHAIISKASLATESLVGVLESALRDSGRPA